MNETSRPAHWRMLQDRLEPMLALDAEARAVAIAKIRAESPELADELQALLDAADDSELPDSLPGEVWHELADDTPDRSGKRFGPFVVEAEIGRGGSGTVYRARRDGDFEQRVAIKLLSRVRADPAAARRLLHERDVLAKLDHPGIVRLLDAGVDSEGQPYLVLEHVAGRTWDRFLAEAGPPAGVRLELFAQVCDAVAYAHQRLLVHRDIKPGNLMVDNEGRPKLLDYGIAKILVDTDDSTLTRDCGSSLTPAYAAPEQLRGEAVTTATDVFALGILLYETLCGAHPFMSQQRRGESLRSAILNEAPAPIATQAGLIVMTPAWQQDLQRVLSMALAKEPELRYASARELAEDVRAVLAGRPVRAQSPSAGYLVRRFVGRHRLAVGMATLAVALLVLATGSALWQWRVAALEHARAERRFQDVHRFANVVLFDYHEGIRNLSGSLPMQQRLVTDALGYLESLARDAGDDPALRADLVRAYLKVGDIQGNPYGPNLGDLEGASRSYDRAAEFLASMATGDPGNTDAGLLRAQLLARRADLAHQRGEPGPARSHFEQALVAFSGLPQDTRAMIPVVIEHAHLLDHYGDFLGREGAASANEVAASRKVHEEARALRLAALATAPEDTGLHFGLYHSALREGEYWLGQNDMVRAEAGLRDALRRIDMLVDANPDNSFYRYEQALVQSRLVPVLDAQGDLEGSIDSALAALAATEILLARDPGNDMLKQAVSASCGWAARQLLKGKRAVEAVPVVARQIEVNEAWLVSGPDNPEAHFALSLAFRRQGELRESLGDFAGAIESHQEAIRRQVGLAGQSADFALSLGLSMMHLGRNQVSDGRVVAGRSSLVDATAKLAAVVAENPEATRYQDYLAEAWAQLAEAWLAAPANRDEAHRAFASARDIWARFDAQGTLSATAAARRDSLAEKLGKH